MIECCSHLPNEDLLLILVKVAAFAELGVRDGSRIRRRSATPQGLVDSVRKGACGDQVAGPERLANVSRGNGMPVDVNAKEFWMCLQRLAGPGIAGANRRQDE